VVAAYGHNPPYPGKVAHQYTDGSGYGGGLPEGAPPFGRCDMNSADGLTPQQFAAACGIAQPVPVELAARRRREQLLASAATAQPRPARRPLA
jgi:hypothetical protein